ncbi:type VI immunity family protein [Xanthomonas oryzae pv. oryzicola]|uniref:type VI immunity family protein n=1 Tax=Xanthomonas oryzae TaxID=347 RepID=UPI003D9FED4F
MSNDQWAKLLAEHEGKLELPGGLLMRSGPENYIGTVLAITGSLYYKGGYTTPVREAVCACFDQYVASIGDQLRWLIKDETKPVQFKRAKPLRDWLLKLDPDDSAIFGYTAGDKPEDASAYRFYSENLRGWKEQRGWGLNALHFSVPLKFIAEQPKAFQRLFVDFARRLNAEHGHGGYGFVLSLLGYSDAPTEAYLSQKLRGADVGNPDGRGLMTGIKTISWLTAINHSMLQQLDGGTGLDALRNELPGDWFAYYDYGAGTVIQAGPAPEIASVDDDPMPANYVLVNHLLKRLRSTTDVPPSLSSTLVWSPIPYPEEIGREEAFFRRTDHRLPARSRGRHADQGPVPAAWLQ